MSSQRGHLRQSSLMELQQHNADQTQTLYVKHGSDTQAKNK